MGNDGGSIPDRRDLVRNKPKAEQADKANQTLAKWFFCALSKRRLLEPIVSCSLGKLYNKDSIIEYLLDKSAYGDGEDICGHIRSLKDVRTLTLTSNPARETEASINANAERAQFICPLSLKEMNGAQPFVYLSTCGCVFSQAGLANVSRSTPPSADSEKSEQLDLCPHCSQKYSRTSDIIILNPSVEEEEKLREAMVQKRLTEPVKKSKKRKAAAAASAEELEHPKKKAAPTPTIRTARKQVLESLAEEEAKRKASMSDAVKALYASSDGNKKKETFMTMGTFTRYA